MIALDIQSTHAREHLQEVLRQAKRPRAIMAAAARACANRLKKHFRERERANPNKLGGRRTHFWLQVMRSVQAPVIIGDGLEARISINHPAFAQKVFGGTIRAKRVKLLTIPVSPEAYGRTASTFEHETGLKLIFMKQRDNIFLAARAEGQGFTIHYLLTPKVDQQADPHALPPMTGPDGLETVTTAAADKALARQLKTPSQTEGPQ